ncbi:TetR/AcrR family transcriptional regulator [Clostridium sp. CX1]|uniref:TetR/AcrR family transcriptional regulator n=1 Tax=Clostridium tanneri TaxID=3037988 RepID=A0ABU4JQ24_9CLOT|nr:MULTISPECIES: TetR/AcrR family transcriptional regulator [unclassified Clostridium]MCT8975300.1 TetR/AcrR family transcriptional regulator [Clostridium sp. CX1]MDW8800223.1 TetR/AcrR family transcriptional regulator [Clostridium sp. A1-XYC3]
MNSIFTKFFSLKPEKQQRILNAAIKEFAKKGYKNTATDEIVKEANISKGALFHYFNSKKGLFIFLYDYTLEILMNEFFGKIDLDEKDILKRLQQVLLTQFMLVNKYPDMLDFVKTANFEDSDEVKNDMELRNKEYLIDAYSKVLNNFDTSKFKENIDIKRAVDVIVWTMEGFVSKEKEKIKDHSITNLNFDEILSEVNIYFELLKSSFYK